MGRWKREKIKLMEFAPLEGAIQVEWRVAAAKGQFISWQVISHNGACSHILPRDHMWLIDLQVTVELRETASTWLG